MKKIIIYVVIALVVLAGLGYLMMLMKTAIKVIIFVAIVFGIIMGYRYVRKSIRKFRGEKQ